MLLVLSLILIITTLSVTYYAFFYKKPEIAFKIDDPPAVSVVAPVEEERIVVHVVGAVKNPGVYTLEYGQRVKDAIDVAGGSLPEADLVRLNLALKLEDEDKLYVPEIGETFDELNTDAIGVFSSDKDKININKASLVELEVLPGIGPATAQKIIDYRDKNGPFKQIEEIKNVSGIGVKKFEQIRDKITIR